MDIKEVIQYQKERYNDELQRFDHFENKCSRFLRSITLMLVLIPLIPSINTNTFLSPNGALDWAAILLFILGSASLLSAWIRCLLALKLGEYTSLPFRKDKIDYMLKSPDEESYDFLYEAYTKAIENLHSEIDRKSKPLQIAFKDIIFSVGTYATTVLIILLKGALI